MFPAQRRSGGMPSMWEDPFGTVEERLNRFMGRLWEDRGSGAFSGYPADVHEDDYNIYIDAELPGFKRDEIDVGFENNVLTISAERKTPLREGCQQHLTERRFTRVQRRFDLPNSVDEHNVTARLEDGVLYITLKKREESHRHKIEIA